MELVSGPWRATSVRITRDGAPREYLRINVGRYHIADVRTIDELTNVLARYGVNLADLAENDQAHLR